MMIIILLILYRHIHMHYLHVHLYIHPHRTFHQCTDGAACPRPPALYSMPSHLLIIVIFRAGGSSQGTSHRVQPAFLDRKKPLQDFCLPGPQMRHGICTQIYGHLWQLLYQPLAKLHRLLYTLHDCCMQGAWLSKSALFGGPVQP